MSSFYIVYTLPFKSLGSARFFKISFLFYRVHLFDQNKVKQQYWEILLQFKITVIGFEVF